MSLALAEAAILRQRVRVITDSYKELNRALALRGFTPKELAGSMLGLGTRMCWELGRDAEVIVAMVRDVMEEGAD